MPVNFPDQGLSLFSIPKNSGTTLWMWSLFIRTGKKVVDANIYDHGWMCDGDIEPESVMIRRDPVDRIISGYRNLRDKRGLWMEFGELVEKVPELIKSEWGNRHHFAPLSDYFPWMPLGKADHVFDFTDFGLVKEILEERCGISLPDYHAQKSKYDDFTVADAQVVLVQQYWVLDHVAGFGDVVDDTELGLQSERACETGSD